MTMKDTTIRTAAALFAVSMSAGVLAKPAAVVVGALP
jgi:hypothetical protein